MFLQKLLFCLDVIGRTLVYFCQFIGINFGTDDGIPFRLDNGVADTIHYVVDTVLSRKQGIESRPLPLFGVFQTAVYAVQFLFEGVDFFQ